MIPLVLMAGFLGAGKTRFLTTLIPQLLERGVRVRIVLNDFENATIDAARLGALEALVTPLNGECVCCGSLRELLDTLQAVPHDPGSVMLIEANGATETDELLGYLTTDTTLTHFTLPLQLTVIDAARWQKRWWNNGLEAAQTTTATHVHLNWTDKLSTTRRDAVHAGVAAVNARAAFTTPQEFAATLQSLAESVRETARRDPQGVATAHRHRQGHTHPFGSVALPLPRLVERARFLAFVQALPAAVVRAKGLVRFADQPADMFVWNRVPGRKKVQLDESSPHADAEATALFIGVGMSLDDLESRIAALT
ncbi:GTP-binding protein [Gemmatimonas sp.]|uniref:GTP-binding protein n=1 Tax=Gemmatimonas sp. TaxID=1962908 RepID=UPI00286ACCED|nr:GTP-binding protein [Gemmatimonas sp.]